MRSPSMRSAMRSRPRDRIILYAGVVLVCALLVFPIYWLFVTAISAPDQLRRSCRRASGRIRRAARYSGRSCASGRSCSGSSTPPSRRSAAVTLSMTVSILAGYSLSRFRVRGGPSLGLFILTAKMLPATLLVIPLFGIFRTVDLIGSLWSIILAHATLIVPFTTWMLKGYFDTIPRELEQAAMVDGCSPLGAMVRVILPVSAPGLAATALYGFVLSWSDYAYARTFLTNAQSNWTANLGITTMKGEYITNWSRHLRGLDPRRPADPDHLPVPRTLPRRRPHGRRREVAEFLPMAGIRIEHVTKSYGGARGAQGLLPRRPGRRVRRVRRALRLRQVDDAQDPGRARGGDIRHDPHRRARRHRPRAGRPRHRDGVPELRALSAPDACAGTWASA